MNYIDFDDYLRKYGQDVNPEAFDKQRTLGSFYERIGVLVSRKLIDSTMVDDLMSNSIVSFWEQFGPMLVEYREYAKWP